MDVWKVAASHGPKLYVLLLPTFRQARTPKNLRFKHQVSCNFVSRCMKPYTKCALSKTADVQGLRAHCAVQLTEGLRAHCTVQLTE
jgi:hypothetical protein